MHDGSTSASPEFAHTIFYRHGGRKSTPFSESAKAVRVRPDPLRGPRAIEAHEKTKIFSKSTFFTEKQAAALTTPDEIRAINKATGEFRETLFDCPLPVKRESLGLLVKCGVDVVPLEAQSQVMVSEKLQGRVPVPVDYRWTEDGGQGFIYMELNQGDTLEERWRGMVEYERLGVCGELKDVVSAWRGLGQKDGDRERLYRT